MYRKVPQVLIENLKCNSRPPFNESGYKKDLEKIKELEEKFKTFISDLSCHVYYRNSFSTSFDHRMLVHCQRLELKKFLEEIKL